MSFDDNEQRERERKRKRQIEILCKNVTVYVKLPVNEIVQFVNDLWRMTLTMLNCMSRFLDFLLKQQQQQQSYFVKPKKKKEKKYQQNENEMQTNQHLQPQNEKKKIKKFHVKKSI